MYKNVRPRSRLRRLGFAALTRRFARQVWAHSHGEQGHSFAQAKQEIQMCEHTFADASAWWLEVDLSVPPCSRRDQAVPLQGAQYARVRQSNGRSMRLFLVVFVKPIATRSVYRLFTHERVLLLTRRCARRSRPERPAIALTRAWIRFEFRRCRSSAGKSGGLLRLPAVVSSGQRHASADASCP